MKDKLEKIGMILSLVTVILFLGFYISIGLFWITGVFVWLLEIDVSDGQFATAIRIIGFGSSLFIVMEALKNARKKRVFEGQKR